MFRIEAYVLFVMGSFLLLTALNIQVGWLFFIVFTLFAILGINFFYPLIILNNINIKRTVNDAYENEDVTISITLENFSKSKKHFIAVTDFFPSTITIETPKQVRMFFLEIPAKGSITRTYKEKAARRGQYTFQPLIIESSAPFGLMRCSKKYMLPSLMTIYPAPLSLISLNSSQPLTGYADSLFFRRSQGATDDFCGLRSYSPGDNLRFVHWRTSAKTQTLMIKEFRLPVSTTMTIFLDVSSNEHEGEGKDSSLELGIKIATSIIKDSLKNGREVQLIANDGFPPLKATSLWSLLSRLAVIPHLESYERLGSHGKKISYGKKVSCYKKVNPNGHSSIFDLIQSVVNQKMDLLHFVLILPINETRPVRSNVTLLLQLLSRLQERRIKVEIVAVLSESFVKPYHLCNPQEQDKNVLNTLTSRICWVTRNEQGVFLA